MTGLEFAAAMSRGAAIVHCHPRRPAAECRLRKAADHRAKLMRTPIGRVYSFELDY
jgi:uncharacterized protein (DUF849 family)